MIYLVLRTKDLLEMIIIFWMNLFVEKKAGRPSVRFCAAKLYNLLTKQNLITTSDNCTVNDISNLYHKLKHSYILNNRELVKHLLLCKD